MVTSDGGSVQSVVLSWLQLAVSVLAIVAPIWFGLWVYRRDHPSAQQAAAHPRPPRPARRVPVWAWVIVTVLIMGFVGVGGMIYFFNRSPIVNDPGPTTSTTTEHSAVVQNIYNVLAARGLQDLREQGFTHVRQEMVCSNSVAAGRVRQVILDNGKPAGSDDEVVGESGSAASPVDFDTPLAVKVSDGPC